MDDRLEENELQENGGSDWAQESRQRGRDLRVGQSQPRMSIIPR